MRRIYWDTMLFAYWLEGNPVFAPRVQAILDSMTTEFRSAFVLAELEELPVREIATLLGVPEGTVASRLRTARAKFREGIKRLQAQNAFAWRKR